MIALDILSAAPRRLRSGRGKPKPKIKKPLFTATGKEVLFDGVHYADAKDDDTASMIVLAMEEFFK